MASFEFGYGFEDCRVQLYDCVGSPLRGHREYLENIVPTILSGSATDSAADEQRVG